MTIKQKIDKYLIDNYADILSKSKVKGFRWQPIADQIGKNINKEAVRVRWKEVKKKQELLDQKAVTKVISENKEKPLEIVTGTSVTPITEEEVKNYTIVYTPISVEKPKEKCNFITWIKNLFK